MSLEAVCGSWPTSAAMGWPLIAPYCVSSRLRSLRGPCYGLLCCVCGLAAAAGGGGGGVQQMAGCDDAAARASRDALQGAGVETMSEQCLMVDSSAHKVMYKYIAINISWISVGTRVNAVQDITGGCCCCCCCCCCLNFFVLSRASWYFICYASVFMFNFHCMDIIICVL